MQTLAQHQEQTPQGWRFSMVETGVPFPALMSGSQPLVTAAPGNRTPSSGL